MWTYFYFKYPLMFLSKRYYIINIIIYYNSWQLMHWVIKYKLKIHEQIFAMDLIANNIFHNRIINVCFISTSIIQNCHIKTGWIFKKPLKSKVEEISIWSIIFHNKLRINKVDCIFVCIKNVCRLDIFS